MPEGSGGRDPAAIWKNQPVEEVEMNPGQILGRRTDALYASTRAEILMSIGAALLLMSVVVLRFWPVRSGLEELGCGLVVLWGAAMLLRLRGSLRRDRPRADAAAATGADYYRKELERRRDHLRDAWLWHGPLFVACLMLAGLMSGWGAGRGVVAYRPAGQVAPLLALLVAWVIYGVWRRLRQAQEIQHEIDEIGRESARR